MNVVSGSPVALFGVVALLVACGTANDSTPTAADAGPDAAREPELGLNDVSVLAPLPPSQDAEGWLSATSAGAMGELLPRAVFDAIPTFPVNTANALNYAFMRVLGIRFDGCHKATSDDSCHAQVRMVMQPVNFDGEARDSALHLFYSLSDTQFAGAVTRLRAMRALAPEQTVDAALSVSPALAAQGMGGRYAQALHSLVLELCGEQNLTRMTFFLRAPPNQETWFFGGFERKDSALETMNIRGVGAGNQRVIRVDDNGAETGYSYDISPSPIVPEDGRALLSTKAAAAANTELRATTFASYLRLENPRLYTPDEAACAGCHISAYIVGESQRVFGLSPSGFPDAQFASKHLIGPKADRQTESGAQRSSLRAFGYFESTAMVAPRTVNETAAVLEDIEARYAAKSL